MLMEAGKALTVTDRPLGDSTLCRKATVGSVTAVGADKEALEVQEKRGHTSVKANLRIQIS